MLGKGLSRNKVPRSLTINSVKINILNSSSNFLLVIQFPTIMFRAIISAACAYIAMHNPNNIRSKANGIKKSLYENKIKSY